MKGPNEISVHLPSFDKPFRCRSGLPPAQSGPANDIDSTARSDPPELSYACEKQIPHTKIELGSMCTNFGDY